MDKCPNCQITLITIDDLSKLTEELPKVEGQLCFGCFKIYFEAVLDCSKRKCYSARVVYTEMKGEK